jgi:SOS response regulatory protein OraA/RecX
VRAFLLADRSGVRRLVARLAHAGVEPEIIEQLLGGAEATDVADRGEYA